MRLVHATALLTAFLAFCPLAARAALASALPAIAANDNTVAGGHIEGRTVHLDLVARRGLWYPDGPGTLGLPIEAFGEATGPLRIPGPLLRAQLGTRVVATVHNELSHDLTIRGLVASADALTTALHVPRGETRRVTFVLDRPGAFGYYGSDTGETIDARAFDDAELSGAIVVDAPHVPPVDHVFVLGLYAPVKEPDGSPNFIYFLETINGRAFPATEHLTYERGRHVRWAVYNASDFIHPMHLHGFYFRTAQPDAYDEVTHAFYPGEAEELSWTADRAGAWMYHCHIDDHISRHAPLSDMLAHKADPTLTVRKRFDLPNQPMGGMVIAIDVLPRSGDRPPAVAASPRKLALDITSHDVPNARYGLSQDAFTLTDGTRSFAQTGSIGPPIVLVQGEPVAIAVTNHMTEATTVHWHGISLEDSYDDGGAGMGKMATASKSMPMQQPIVRMAPAIEPGQTFVARFTPPDAGTFMYHSHMDDGWQNAGGLVGPLIVVPRGKPFDPTTDHIVMISESFETAGSPFVAIDGSRTPAPLTATVGVPQRLRFSELSLSGDHLVVSLSDGGRPIAWTPIAKDGHDLPPRLQRSAPAVHALTIGETRDFRFTPTHPGAFAIGVYDMDNNDILVGSQTIDVSAP
jgi:FtsP/CotA-like multicopper oxidase with cupredoxin domain